MAKQTINLGTITNDGTGTTLKAGGDMINDNFTELYDPRIIVLPAGTATAGTAPLKFTEQSTPLAAVEPGTMEYVEHSLQFSQYLKRRAFAMTQDVRVSSTTLQNTTTESETLATAQHGAGYLRVGKCEEIILRGRMSQRSNGSSFLNIKVKYAGVTIHTVTTSASNLIAPDSPFTLTISTTCRSIGVSGTMQINSFLNVAGEPVRGGSNLVTINTTIAENTIVTAQWNDADAANIFIVEQGRTLCIEPNY